jgi:hypothetical protein
MSPKGSEEKLFGLLLTSCEHIEPGHQGIRHRSEQPARTKDLRLNEMESNGRESYVRVLTDFRYRHGDINMLTLSHR